MLELSLLSLRWVNLELNLLTIRLVNVAAEFVVLEVG